MNNPSNSVGLYYVLVFFFVFKNTATHGISVLYQKPQKSGMLVLFYAS